MDYILIITGAVCMVIGFLGCFVPILPGIQLSYVGILLLHLSSKEQFSWQFLVFWTVTVLLVSLSEYFQPKWGSIKLGGGRRGAWGSAIGVLVGVFVIAPWGILIFPFVGAVLGELTGGKHLNPAIKAGFGSFVGFMAGMIFKLVVATALGYFFFKDVIYFLWKMIQSF